MATIVAGRLEAARAKRGLSQRALAEAAGITRQAVGAIESGRMQPGVAIALSLARVLETTVEALFGETTAAAPQRRIAEATIEGRRVEHALDREHLAIEPGGDERPAIFVAGCDVAVGLLSRHATLLARDRRALWLPMTNRASLDALLSGNAHAAVVHAVKAGEREPDLQHFTRYEIATTEAGWMLARGNPLRFHGAADLAATRTRLANRPRGAQARTILDAQLRRARVDRRNVLGYERALAGQLDAARAIDQDFADVAIGAASAARAYGLDFIPLARERCTLLLTPATAKSPDGRLLIEALRSPAYRRDLHAIDSYDITRTGERIR